MRGRLAVDGRLRRAQEIGHGHPGDLDRVLHREEEAGASARIHRHREHVFAVERDRTARDVIFRMPGDRVREGRLARPVRPHDGVDRALLDRQVDALEDLFGAPLDVDADLQVFDDEC